MSKRKCKMWTEEELQYLRENFSTSLTKDIAECLHRNFVYVGYKARKMGLRKDPQFIMKTNMDSLALAAKFVKGRIPFNKGKPRREWMSQEKIDKQSCHAFKKGHMPWTSHPVGYEAVRDGYLKVKVAKKRRMVLKHRWVWEQAHGMIPKGNLIIFRDGNRMNCDLSNLQMVTRAEAMRMMIARETEEERKAKVERIHATRNKTIRRDRIRIHWGLEPKTKLVKNW